MCCAIRVPVSMTFASFSRHRATPPSQGGIAAPAKRGSSAALSLAMCELRPSMSTSTWKVPGVSQRSYMGGTPAASIWHWGLPSIKMSISPLGVCVCLLLQYLLQSCSRGGRGIMEDMCYERRRAEALVDYKN